MVLRSWFLEGLVPEEKVMEMFRELRTRRASADNEVEEEVEVL